jgi:hypothetical protein
MFEKNTGLMEIAPRHRGERAVKSGSPTASQSAGRSPAHRPSNRMCHGFGAVLLQRIRTGDCLVFIASAADLNELRAGLAQVAAGQGTLGTSLASLQSAGTYAATDEANLQSAQSTLVSADTTEVATDLNSAEVQQKALLSVMSSSAVTSSLFDYMNS